MKQVDNKSVLEHLDGIAIHWKSLVHPNDQLADYGGARNMLECSVAYVNQVASLNAGAVWMQRRMADVYDRMGNALKAKQYRADADGLAAEVLKLYVPGEGVWNVRHNDGTTGQARHCYDYVDTGLYLTPDLTPQMKTEMTGFVEKELVVPGWMRALSLIDPASKTSVTNRTDHGWCGSYDAWPALAAATMCTFGQYDKALDLIHNCESVTHEGPFAQSHAIVSKKTWQIGTASAPIDSDDIATRIWQGGQQNYNAECGSAFASSAIMEGLFGCETHAKDGPLTLRDSATARGFEGILKGIYYRGPTIPFPVQAGD